MGLPEFPKLPAPPSRETLFALLIQTIVFEEQALATLVHAEAEKVQELVAAGLSGPITPDEAAEINRSVAEVIRAAGEKEERLLKKLRLVTSFPKKKCYMAGQNANDQSD